MEQETSYLALLSRAVSFRVDGPVLELIDVTGSASSRTRSP